MKERMEAEGGGATRREEGRKRKRLSQQSEGREDTGGRGTARETKTTKTKGRKEGEESGEKRSSKMDMNEEGRRSGKHAHFLTVFLLRRN
jgi:hypothetical protein